MFFFRKWYEADDKLYTVVDALKNSSPKNQKILAREVLQKIEYYRKQEKLKNEGFLSRLNLNKKPLSSLTHKEYVKNSIEKLKNMPFEIQTKIAGEILQSEIWKK